MRIFAIDDEPGVLETLHEAIETAAPEAEISDFRRGQAALDAVTEQGIFPDVVFSDIRMPDMNGLQLASEFKKAAPDARIIFVTAYSDYALEAWQSHVQGFLMKPVTAEDIRDTLDRLRLSQAHDPSDPLRVRCFGYFEVFWKKEPLVFKRKKTKELFAALVLRNGAACSAEELISLLYENTDPEEMRKAKQNLRNLIFDLTETMNRIGQQEVLLRRGSSIAVRPDLLDCDYYRMLKGEKRTYHDDFRGEFMEQYSWAESVKGSIEFKPGTHA